MKARLLPFLFAASTLLFACSQGGTGGETKEVDVNFPETFPSGRKEGNVYPLKVDYSDSYFKSSAKEVSKPLAVLSYCLSGLEDYPSVRKAFYDQIGFDNMQHYGLDNTDYNGIGYFLAHKTIGEEDIISVAMRSGRYKQEWGGNFIVGESGDHEGFNISANTVYDGLKQYIQRNYADKKLKIWVTGYSRGGAIADVLAYKIFEEKKDIAVSQDNAYFYCFEPPCGLIEERQIAFPNVHNYVNDIDLVPKIPPKAWGLGRCGVDIPIDYSLVDEAMAAFDPDYVVPQFTPIEGIAQNEKEFLGFIMDTLLSYQGEENDRADISTRAKYVAHQQDGLAYLISRIMSKPEEIFSTLKEEVSTMSGLDYLKLLSKDGLYDIIAPAFDQASIAYEETPLMDACDGISRLITAHMSTFLPLVLDLKTMKLNQSFVDDFLRIAIMHMPETSLALLLKI